MVRNILIVGITGSGKSALANVLTDNSDINYFREEESGVSVTKEFKKGSFECEGVNYYVIDNVGFGDNRNKNTSEEAILYEVAKAIYFIREEIEEGIDQVFFVFRGRFSKANIENFNLFRGIILESGITKFTTLVHTKFEKFEDPQKCEEDKKALLENNKAIKEIIESCNSILHVDNPTLDIVASDNEDEEGRIKRENEINSNRKQRETSRKILLSHLGSEDCSSTYNLREQSRVCKIYDIIEKHIKKEKEVKKNNNSTKRKNELEKIKNAAINEIKKELGEEINAVMEQNTQKSN